jgi:hypothetical protein
MASHQLLHFAEFAKEIFFLYGNSLQRKIIFLHGMSALIEATFVLSGKGMWQKKFSDRSLGVDLRELIVLFCCTQNVQGQFDGDPLVDKLEECIVEDLTLGV